MVRKNQETDAEKMGEGIIVPIFWHFGKLNFTNLGDIRRRSRQDAYFGSLVFILPCLTHTHTLIRAWGAHLILYWIRIEA